jgi:hypothetical protein
MNLVLLHGPPAVGKLTVARELARLTGWRLFHNHLAVDFALALHDFGTPGFVALREKLWRDGFAAAVSAGLPGLIFTFNPENSVSQTFIDGLVRDFSAPPHAWFGIALTAPESELEHRLAAPDRHTKRKLVDLDLYRRLRAAGTFDTPVLPPPQLRVETGELAPAEAAAQIRDALVAASLLR